MPPQKGKQATKGQKQILEENKETLKFYTAIATIATGLNVAVSLLFYWEDFGALCWFLLTFSLVIYIGSQQFMRMMAKPSFSETGQLIDGGIDLNMESGFAEHVKDLILLTAGCQVLSLISYYFWLLWLLAPGRAFYILWINILQPWIFQPAPEIDEKKQKKMERKMARKQHLN